MDRLNRLANFIAQHFIACLLTYYMLVLVGFVTRLLSLTWYYIITSIILFLLFVLLAVTRKRSRT